MSAQEASVIAAARKLIARLYEVDNHPHYRRAFFLAENHGMKYAGPTYYEEGAALAAALYAMDHPPIPPATAAGAT